jgi:predicted 2-oxoglutarate/Fe(II)-dependent dioxygenase YbiX
MTAPFVAGDCVPEIGLLGRDGGIVNLFRQDLAGATLALWRTGPHFAQKDQATAERLAHRFAEADAHLIHLVVGGTPNDVAAPKADSGLIQIFDPRNEIAPLFGLAGDGIVLIDRNRRFIGARAGDTPDDALTACRALLQNVADGAVTCQAPVLLVTKIFDASETQALVTYWENSERELVNNVARNVEGTGNTYHDPQTKRRVDTVVRDRVLFDLVKTRIERRVFPEILKSFQCRIARMEMPRIGCYDSAERGEFKRHRDNATTYTAHRKFAISINLNGGYRGGELNFPEYGRQLYHPAAGDGVVFSCGLLHEARPVTRGRRFGLFTFFTDAEGGQREDEMFAKNRNLTQYTVG